MCAISDDMNTPEQHAYVASVPDDMLRGALLHCIRLRDNNEAEAKGFETEANRCIEQVRALRKELETKTAEVKDLHVELHNLRQTTQVLQGRLDMADIADTTSISVVDLIKLHQARKAKVFEYGRAFDAVAEGMGGPETVLAVKEPASLGAALHVLYDSYTQAAERLLKLEHVLVPVPSVFIEACDRDNG